MHRRSQGRRPQQAPPRARTAAVRPARLTAAGAALTALVVVLLLAWAAVAEAAVWVIPAASRAYPSTKAGARQTISLDAAGNEYQGVQVCVRGGDRKVRLSWSTDSHPLIVDNAELSRVFYVKVKTPTTKLGSRPGWYPDPLVPRDFGAVQSVPGSVNPGPTTPFYVLVHVPLGTEPGEYTATLRVENDVAGGGEVVDIPFRLRVWSFGWQRISTRSAFAMSQENLKTSLPRRFTFDGQNKADVLRNFYTMMKQHGISPTTVHYLPKVSDSSGAVAEGDWAAKVAPFLDENDGAVGVQDTQLPFLRWFPWSRSQHPSSDAMLNYLTQMTREYKERGWHKKAYIYILDETTKRSEEKQAERYARLAHKASARSGYRIKFLLTDDPRPRSLGGVKTANTFLYDDVDIWTLRYYYFFGRIPAVRERKKAGKEIWWYSYTNDAVRKTPSFVIDKPHIDSRIWGWMMEEWNVDGLLNWGFNRWGNAKTGNGWRDPYKDPLSLIKGKLRANGCTSLLYPGYYPRYGLDDPKAPPVSSLRLEMLRDGLEEREYLKLAKAQGADGRALADKVLRTITTFPYKIRQANVFNFPRYTSSNATFDAARLKLAEFIESRQQ
jgi:hypothetical protein